LTTLRLRSLLPLKSRAQTVLDLELTSIPTNKVDKKSSDTKNTTFQQKDKRNSERGILILAAD